MTERRELKRDFTKAGKACGRPGLSTRTARDYVKPVTKSNDRAGGRSMRKWDQATFRIGIACESLRPLALSMPAAPFSHPSFSSRPRKR